MTRVQCKIAALDVVPDQDRKYFMYWLEHNNEQMFRGLAKNLVGEERQSKINIYTE